MDDEPDLRRLTSDSEQSDTNEEILRRLIRLIVGIVLVGQDALRNQLPKWEAEAAAYLEKQQIAKEVEETGAPAAPPATPWFPAAWEHRLIGLAFESPKYLKARMSQIQSTRRSLWRLSAPLRLPLDVLGISDFTHNWLEGFVDRFQKDWDQLEQIGRIEAQPSRALGQTALTESLDELLDYLAGNQGIQDLVQTQTTGITEEVIDEVRERSVSLDTLIEVVVRKLLRQPALPPGKLLATTDDSERKDEW